MLPCSWVWASGWRRPAGRRGARRSPGRGPSRSAARSRRSRPRCRRGRPGCLPVAEAQRRACSSAIPGTRKTGSSSARPADLHARHVPVAQAAGGRGRRAQQERVVPGDLRDRVGQLLEPGVVGARAVVELRAGGEDELELAGARRGARRRRARRGRPAAGRDRDRGQGARGQHAVVQHAVPALARSRPRPGGPATSPARGRSPAGRRRSRAGPAPRPRSCPRRAAGSGAGPRSASRSSRARRPTPRGSARSGTCHDASAAVSSTVAPEVDHLLDLREPPPRSRGRPARRRPGCRRGRRASSPARPCSAATSSRRPRATGRSASIGSWYSTVVPTLPSAAFSARTAAWTAAGWRGPATTSEAAPVGEQVGGQRAQEGRRRGRAPRARPARRSSRPPPAQLGGQRGDEGRDVARRQPQAVVGVARR